MDKLLDLFLKTPLAKRLAAGLVERALLAIGMAIGTWLAIDAQAYQAELNAFVAEAVPYAVAAVFAIIAVKRIKKAEATIEVARVSPAGVPRPIVDAHVKAMQREPELAPIVDAPLVQPVPPGTVDRTD